MIIIPKAQVEQYRIEYPKGTHIMLDFTDDLYTDVTPGMIGTVICVDDAGTIHTKWENGSQLGMIPYIDKFHKV